MGTLIWISSILAFVITNFFLFSILDVYNLHVDVICIVRVHHIPFGKGAAFAMSYSILDCFYGVPISRGLIAVIFSYNPCYQTQYRGTQKGCIHNKLYLNNLC